MAEIQLLTTADNVKMIAVLDDNVADNYLRAAIMEAQEVGLRGVLGTPLLEALKDKASRGKLTGAYAELVNSYAVYYLAYATKAELLHKLAYKASNAGVVKADAEGYKAASATEIDTEVARAQAKADYHCFRMQGWLYENRAQFPELAQVDADRIAATLRSAASCGIWLGGARGNWYSERNRDLWGDC